MPNYHDALLSPGDHKIKVFTGGGYAQNAMLHMPCAFALTAGGENKIIQTRLKMSIKLIFFKFFFIIIGYERKKHC